MKNVNIYKWIPLICCILFLQNKSAGQTISNPHHYTPKDTVLYVVGYAHLDDEWVWDYQTVISKYLANTLKDNFKYFEKYPDYIFNFSGSNRYRQFKEYYPDDYETLKQYVKAGRWHPCGGSVVENDVLNPSPESVLRQVLYGNGFFKKEFGVEDHDYLLPDCFGFPHFIPSILVHCGIKGFSTQKLTWASCVGIPFNVGTWTGPDGESVVAALNAGDYTGSITDDWSNNKKWIDRVVKDGNASSVYADYSYYGTGDRGGAPKEKSAQWLEKSLHSNGPVKLISANSDQLFLDITPEEKNKLPNYNSELMLTYHSCGSLTSQAFMKKANRKNELLAYSAEATSVMAQWLGGAAYPQSKINEAWELVLSSQFHDILSGTALPRAYEFAWNDEILAANQFENVLCNATGVIAGAMNTKGTGTPLVVYNPLSIDRDDIVSATVQFKDAAPKNVKVFDKDNNEVPTQVVKTEGRTATILFRAKVSSVGFATYDVRSSDMAGDTKSNLKVTPNTLENERYIVKINANGDIASIYDKTEKREALSAPARLAFQYEKPMQCPAWNMDWTDQKKQPVGYVDGKPTMRIVENGPVRVAIQIVREARGSKFVQEVSLTENSGVVVKNNIDWYTKEYALKATFPLTVSNPIATYDDGLGTIERPNNDSLQYEFDLKQWFDLTDKSREYGVSVLSESKNGADKPNDNTMRLTLLYTPGVRTEYQNQSTQDFGKHEITYVICPHKYTWQDANTPRDAAELNQPMLAFQTTAHEGALGKSFSFLQSSNPDVMVKAIKKAENSDDIIVRVYETKGKASSGNILSFNTPIVSAHEVNGQEDQIANMGINEGKLYFDITPYHPKTFAVKLAAPGAKSNLPKCAIVAIPYNTDVVSYDGNKTDGAMDNTAATYPAEMIPDTVISEDIKFVVGSKKDKQKNALTCAGQKIALPGGNYNSIYILAAASDGDAEGNFTVDNNSVKLKIENWYGFIGQWDNRIWENYKHQEADYVWKGINYIGLTPGYIKKDNVACFATHRHLSDGSNEPYIYCYMYKYKMDVAQGAKELTLPNNSSIKIFGITAAYNNNDAIKPATMLFDTLNGNKSGYKRFQLAAMPKINPANAILENGKPISVSLTAEEKSTKEDKVEVRYTLDGSEPDEHSAMYTQPIIVNKPTAIKAAVFINNVRSSNTTGAEYFFKINAQDNVSVTGNGLQYKSYHGKWEQLPDFNTLQPDDAGTVNNFDISSKASANNIGFVFNGYIKVPTDGVYKLYLNSDDGSKLILDGKYIIDNDFSHSATELSKAFPLAAGYHTIRVLYFDGGGDKALDVNWEGPGMKKTGIPDNMLFH